MRTLVWSVIDALEVNRPEKFVIENVVEFRDEWMLYKDCIRMIRRLGYRVSEQVLNSEAWSVPQARERLFVIGTLGPRSIRVHDPKRFTPRPMGECVSWGDGEWMPFSEAQGPGMREQLRKAARILGDQPGAILLVSHRPVFTADQPLRTMTTKDQFRWVYRKRFRYPTAREAFALMGFPADYVIPDHVAKHRTIAWALAGDAVCPPVMRGIVERIMDAA
jgi:DNA (cytosine-5)-methyltransferase 1